MILPLTSVPIFILLHPAAQVGIQDSQLVDYIAARMEVDAAGLRVA
jgi:hypothetical protein